MKADDRIVNMVQAWKGTLLSIPGDCEIFLIFSDKDEGVCVIGTMDQESRKDTTSDTTMTTGPRSG